MINCFIHSIRVIRLTAVINTTGTTDITLAIIIIFTKG